MRQGSPSTAVISLNSTLDLAFVHALADATGSCCALVAPDGTLAHVARALAGRLDVGGVTELSALAALAAEQGLGLRRELLPGGWLLVVLAEDAQRREVLRVALHDLRSPVASVRTFAGLMIRRPLPPERMASAGHALARSADRALIGISDFLESELAALGPLEVRRTPTALGPLIAEAAARPLEVHAEKQLRWSVRDLPGTPVCVDPDRLSHAISAVVERAMARAPPQSEVTLRAHLDGPHLAIEVSDAGGPPTPEDTLGSRNAQVLAGRRLSPACGLSVALAGLQALGGGLEAVAVSPGVVWRLIATVG